MPSKKFDTEFKKICGDILQTNVSLKNYSYLKTGGKARYFVNLSDDLINKADQTQGLSIPEKTINKLTTIIAFLKSEKMDYRILGRGTNIIINDGLIETVVIYPIFRHLEKWEILSDSPKEEHKIITLPASLPLIRALKNAHDDYLRGLEFCMGIPGSLGGAVVMNSGVKDEDISGVLKSVLMLRDGEILEVPKDDLDLSYRHSNIKKDEIILKVSFELPKVNALDIRWLKKKALDDLSERKKTQPLKYPSVGSTFKNPLPEYAGELIERSKLKNRHVGGMWVSHKHANFILNDGTGTSAQALKLIRIIRESVYANTGVQLELEVQKFGY